MGVWRGTASVKNGIRTLLQGSTGFTGRTFVFCFGLGCVGLPSTGPFLHKKLLPSGSSRKNSAYSEETRWPYTTDGENGNTVFVLE
ncbi:hypothetical protein COCON_G00134680 [Conger conger]|uniref:Uncharacterized protein n=1 Tax=Conger conger TaxID=82655 RepID=A0A9Q1DF28_CONCO|nr:hypothetical protein COCON_G00134680 [Conger conger]